MELELTACTATDERPSSRRRSHTLVVEPARSTGEHAAEARGFVAVFEVADSPPSWFDVPADDLQPALASAVETSLRQSFHRASHEAPREIVRHMITEANTAIHVLRSSLLYAGSFGVVVLAVLGEDRANIGWLGDARAYESSSAGVVLLSRDHTVLEEWIELQRREGRAPTQEEIETFPYRGIISRVLGAESTCSPGAIETVLEPGRRLVLCNAGGALAIERATFDAAASAIANAAVTSSPGTSAGIVVVRAA